MNEINEKGPAVSSDATYMVLGFLSVLFLLDLSSLQRKTNTNVASIVSQFPLSTLTFFFFSIKLLFVTYLMKLTYMISLKNNLIKISRFSFLIYFGFFSLVA